MVVLFPQDLVVNQFIPDPCINRSEKVTWKTKTQYQKEDKSSIPNTKVTMTFPIIPFCNTNPFLLRFSYTSQSIWHRSSQRVHTDSCFLAKERILPISEVFPRELIMFSPDTQLTSWHTREENIPPTTNFLVVIIIHATNISSWKMSYCIVFLNMASTPSTPVRDQLCRRQQPTWDTLLSCIISFSFAHRRKETFIIVRFFLPRALRYLFHPHADLRKWTFEKEKKQNGW